jgi:macrolide transport system ATP-binding/permease protein
MSDILGRVSRKLGMLLRRERFQDDLDEEMAFHRDQMTRELEADGMSREEARYAAMRQFGNAVRLKDESQEAVGFKWESVMQDLRFALRQLRKNPGFTLVAVLILTLGVCASVAIFGFVDAALIKPLPYAEPSRLMSLFETNALGSRFHLSYPDYLDWKKTNTVFSSMDTFSSFGFILNTSEGTQQVQGATVTAGFFHTLGVAPMLGRDFYPNEDSAPARTVLLSYSAWQKRYGARPDVVGQAVTLDGAPVTIVGVLPKDFHFAPAEPAEFWAVERASGDCEKNRGCHDSYGVGRLKDGVSFASAMADIRTIADQIQRQYPDADRARAAFMLPLTEVIVGDIRPILLVLLSGAAMLLLIACVNVSSLLLVRSESRRREIAVRGALGASRGRLMRQFITEGLLLSVSGSLLGTGCAWVAMQLLVRMIPKDMMASMPYLQGVSLNWSVMAFALLVCVLMSVCFALTPALRLSLAQMREGLTEGGRGSSGQMWRRLGSNLVVIELAIAMILLAGAGLLGKSFYHLLHVDTGLQPDHLAAIQIAATGASYAKEEQQVVLAREIQQKISSLPGVKSVGLTDQLPLGDGDGIQSFGIAGHENRGEHNEAIHRAVSAGYFSTLQAKLVQGRYFTEDEDKTKPLVVVVNSQMAKKYFHGESAVGKRITFGDDFGTKPIEIVGVVNDIQEGQLDAAPREAIYTPLNQQPENSFALIVRTSQAEDSLLPALETAIHEVDPGLATFGALTMSERIHDSPAAYLHRSSAWLVGGFALLALLLSVVGLYGVIAYSVSQRTREIGVRMALGAQRSAVYGMILREAGWLTALGVAAGAVCSVGAGLLMRKLLFGVSSWDVSTLIAVAVVLALAAAVASYLPARRAASVNPVEALRAE